MGDIGFRTGQKRSGFHSDRLVLFIYLFIYSLTSVNTHFNLTISEENKEKRRMKGCIAEVELVARTVLANIFTLTFFCSHQPTKNRSNIVCDSN